MASSGLRASGRSLVLAAATLAAALILLRHLGGAAVAGSAPSPTAADFEVLGCALTPTIRADPLRVPLGEAVTLSLRVQGSCKYWIEPQHVVFVIDASSALSVDEFDRLRAWFQVSIDRIEIDALRRIGVVIVGNEVRTVCSLGDERETARGCLDGIEPAGEPNIAAGLRQGLAALQAGHALIPEGRGFEQFLILVSQGRDPRGCELAVEAASEASRAGALRIAICASNRCEAECLRSIAASARYYYGGLDIGRGFIEALEPVDRRTRPPAYLRLVTASMRLGDAWPLVPGSASPLADVSDPRRPAWQASFVGRDGVTFSLALRSTEPGIQAVADAVHSGVRSDDNRSYTADLDPPIVEVLVPEPTPTAPPARCYLPQLLVRSNHSLAEMVAIRGRALSSPVRPSARPPARPGSPRASAARPAPGAACP